MDAKPTRDIEKDYPLDQFVEKLRRLADALESGQRFEIKIAGERISVPVRQRTTSNMSGAMRKKRSSSRSSGHAKLHVGLIWTALRISDS